jgi:hypothetical protein
MIDTFDPADHSRGENPASAHNTSLSAALWFSALIVCLAMSSGRTKRDRSSQSTLEKLSQLTAVGDLRTYPWLEARPPEIRFKRKTLIIQPGSDTIRDSEMLLVAQSDNGEYGLYRPKERDGQSGDTDEGLWYIKVAINGYVRATTGQD